jgi:hypothetical protein
MCEHNGNIIFCTCDFGDEYPKEYWVLYRFAEGKDLYILGSPMLPSVVEDLTDFNAVFKTIRKTLNKGNCFDKELDFKANDVLIIQLDRFEQSFQYKFDGLKWKKYMSKNVWDIENKYDQIKTGIIKADLIPFLK